MNMQLNLYLVTATKIGTGKGKSFILQSVIAAESEEAAKELMNPPLPKDLKLLFRHIGYAAGDVDRPEIILIGNVEF